MTIDTGFFVSRRIGTQLFPTATLAVVQFDTAVINDGGCWDFINHQYVCPKAGRMNLSIAYSVAALAGATDLYLILQCSNTALLNQATTFATSLVLNQRFSYSNSLLLNVNFGTTLKMNFYSTNAQVSSNVLAEESCFFCGQYVG